MKKLISFAVFVCMAVLSSCDGGKNTFTITGTVSDPNYNGKVVYMSDYEDGLIADSTVVTNGKFVFKGIADNTTVKILNINNLSAFFIIEKGNFTVDMGTPFSGKGNVLTEKLNEFASRNDSLFDEVIMKASRQDSEVFEEYMSKFNDLAAFYLREHSNDLFGAMVFLEKVQMQRQMDQSAESFNKAKVGMGEKILNFGPVKKMAEIYENMNRTSVGNMFTDFTITNGNSDNTPAKFSDYIGKGKYVLVDFWASWCGPCLKELPNLKTVYDKYKGDKFDILGVAVWDKREATLEAIEKEGIKWNQIIDAQSIPTDIYGIQGIPHIILFAPDGVIVARDLRGDGIGKKIAEVLAKK